MMWQRFTERARRAVFFAQEEAGRLGGNYVSTEHLLLGLMREEGSVASRILDRMGVPSEKIRSEVERQMSRGDGRLEQNSVAGRILDKMGVSLGRTRSENERQDMQLTPRGKRVIDLAYDEARRINHNYIGTEHLLLGLIREGEGLAGRALSKLGVELERARIELMNLQDNESNAPEHSVKPESVKTPYHGGEASGLAEVNAVAGKILEDETKWRKKSFVSLLDITGEQFNEVLEVAAGLKALDLARRPGVSWSYPRTLAMLFEKPSLRTRVSFEVSMAHLRGYAINLSPNEVGLGSRESVKDVASVLSRWVDIISARVFDHETVKGLAKYATVPVINALSDAEHPLQACADLLTLREKKGELGSNLKLAYVGDGNNVLHALLIACAMTGVNISAAFPEGYAPSMFYVTEAERLAVESGAIIELTNDPVAAVAGADAVYTDVWASMGQEEEAAERAALFQPYQLNLELMTKAKADAIALHCLPAHRGEEVTDEVMEKYADCIYEQAENRMHTQKALLALIIGL